MKLLRFWQLFWGAFIGIGAYWGAAMMFIDPTGKMWGMEALLPMLQQLPFADFFFQNFIWSGIALLIVNGLTNTISFFLLKKRHRYGTLSGILCGLILIIWIIAEFFIFGFNFLSDIYLAFGILQAGNGLIVIKKEKETQTQNF
ncbi:MAG: hypothetical protein EOM76_05950 [Sphingobacteriia bacterium]|jgi:hypothetical protein|nr:hypothetical protein [Sphingobacteriia bacterium]